MNREEWIVELNHRINRVKGNYFDFIELHTDHAEEIVSLLKEQETHEKELPVRQYVGEYFGAVSICPSCEASWIMGDDDDLHFCPHCGQKVKFEHN